MLAGGNICRCCQRTKVLRCAFRQEFTFNTICTVFSTCGLNYVKNPGPKNPLCPVSFLIIAFCFVFLCFRKQKNQLAIEMLRAALFRRLIMFGRRDGAPRSSESLPQLPPLSLSLSCGPIAFPTRVLLAAKKSSLKVLSASASTSKRLAAKRISHKTKSLATSKRTLPKSRAMNARVPHKTVARNTASTTMMTLKNTRALKNSSFVRPSVRPPVRATAKATPPRATAQRRRVSGTTSAKSSHKVPVATPPPMSTTSLTRRHRIEHVATTQQHQQVEQQKKQQHSKRKAFLQKWHALSPQARRIAVRRIVGRRSFPRAAHLTVPAVPAAAEEWLQESGELPATSAATPGSRPPSSAYVVGGDENVVILDAPTINAEELKERDARIAMRLLMSQHFRVTQRPIAEESRLRRQKYEEVSKPLLQRDYQKRLNTQSEELTRWKRSPRSILQSAADAYDPERDARVAPVAASSNNAFGGPSTAAERGFMRNHYEDDSDDANLFFSHPPPLFGNERGAVASIPYQGTSPIDDGSVLLQPPTSHLLDTMIPVRLHVDNDVDFRDDDDDEGPFNRRDRGA
ncbi:Hypothetical protein, putative [Bodo saltans]|uniref:Uncharacterized protein n=1 Tax=Bodo saltans TaxID=75058 RepID=A0A0S4J790_BODSA|nr:Hypothetical protein, putative [Bodo saltans]|eukprot:CUG86323.1 Hypothetical protein, putative [Bodo saltans]